MLELFVGIQIGPLVCPLVNISLPYHYTSSIVQLTYTKGEAGSLVEEADVPVDVPPPRLAPQPVVERGHRGKLGARIRQLLLLCWDQVGSLCLTITSLLVTSLLDLVLLGASLRLWEGFTETLISLESSEI